MSFDNHANFAISIVALPPSPATSGSSLTVASGQGSLFPAPPFNCTVWPPNVQPLASNAEIIRVLAVSGDVFTNILRGQENTQPVPITIGFQIENSITALVIQAIENSSFPPSGPAGGDFSGSTYPNPVIAANSVTNAKLAKMPAATFKANVGASLLNAADITPAQAAQTIGGNASDLIIPRGFIDGLILANNAGPSQSIVINPGCTRDNSNAKDIGNTATYYKSLAGTFTAGSGSSGSPVNGLDTGSVAASTWYHVWAIIVSQGSTPDYLFSLSATAPTLPGGYNFAQNIGAVLTDGSKNIVAFHQYGDTFTFDAVAPDANGVAMPTVGTLLTISVPPGIVVTPIAEIGILNANTGVNYDAWGPDKGAGAGANFTRLKTIVANILHWISPNLTDVFTNTSSQVYWMSSAAGSTGYFYTIGWVHPRGRNSISNN